MNLAHSHMLECGGTVNSLPWIKGKVERPEFIYLAIWVGLSYWTIAYLQFLFSSRAGTETYKLVGEAAEKRIRNQLENEHTELIAEKRQALSKGGHDDAKMEINFQGDWIAVFRGAGIKYGNKYKTSYSGGSNWTEYHDLKLDKRSVACAKFHAFCATLTKSPIAWDYVPLLLAASAIACGAFEFGIIMGYW